MKNFTILSSGTAVSYKYFLDAVIIKVGALIKPSDNEWLSRINLFIG